MLHVDGVVIRLRKAAGDRLAKCEESVQQRQSEKRIVDKIVTDAVDVGVNHQRVDKAEDQHDPERFSRIQIEQREKVKEMEQSGHYRQSIPARVREQSRISCGAV